MTDGQLEKRIIPVNPAESLDRDSVRLGNRMLSVLPVRNSDVWRRLCGAVDELIGTDHELFLHDIAVIGSEELPTDVGAAFTTEFWLPPDPEVGTLVIDMNVVEHWLETLLEDEPPRLRRLAPLTPRDFGLATFVLLHVADALTDIGFPPVVVASEPPPHAEALSSLEGVDRIVQVVLGLTSTRSAGLVRLFVPVGMVQSFESFTARSRRTRRGAASVIDRYPRVTHDRRVCARPRRSDPRRDQLPRVRRCVDSGWS